MDLTFSDKETAFRDELRGWLAENQPGAKPAGGRGRRRAVRLPARLAAAPV